MLGNIVRAFISTLRFPFVRLAIGVSFASTRVGSKKCNTLVWAKSFWISALRSKHLTRAGLDHPVLLNRFLQIPNDFQVLLLRLHDLPSATIGVNHE